MVIGNGMVAKKFDAYTKDDTHLIFASGVSNSKQADPDAYLREIVLLQRAISDHPDKILVYFSTCSINDPGENNSEYVLHKKNIEELIQVHQAQFYIFRVSNLVGRSANPNTVLNFFVNHIRSQTRFDLWVNATRNLLDIDDMYLIADYILRNRFYINQVIPIANPVSYPVTAIIRAIESNLNIKANYIPVSKGSHFEIDVSLTRSIIRKLKLDFKEDYLDCLLQKYYLPG